MRLFSTSPKFDIFSFEMKFLFPENITETQIFDNGVKYY